MSVAWPGKVAEPWESLGGGGVETWTYHLWVCTRMSAAVGGNPSERPRQTHSYPDDNQLTLIRADVI